MNPLAREWVAKAATSKPALAGLIALWSVSALLAGDVHQDTAQVVLRTTRCALTLDKDSRAAIVSLVDSRTGLEFVDRANAQELLMLAYTKPGDASGKQQWLGSGAAESVDYTVDGPRLAITFRRLGGLSVTATCTADVTCDDIRWHVRIDGPERIVLETLHFPVLALRAPLAGDGADDAFVAGLKKGGVFRQPSQWPAGKGFWVRQPGQLAAQFACYYNSQAGFYSATRDARGYPKTLECRRTKTGLRWAWQRHAYHTLTEAFDLGYRVAMTTFAAQRPDEPADWRDAADIYKAWALDERWCATPYTERSDVPEWMKAGPAMIRFSRDWLARPERVETWLTDYWGKHFPNAPLVVALWGWEHVGPWISPKYFPPHPSEEGFARVVSAVKKAGGHAFPWPSGYYWNVEYRKRPDGSFEWNDWDDFKKIARPHALLGRAGNPLVLKLPWLHGGRNAPLCRGDAWTRQWFNANAVELMKRGCDMVQVDQVVGGLAPGNGNCFSTTHGHPPGPGLWDTDAFAEQLRSLAVACRRVQPGAVLSIEEPQELFNHLVGIQDYRDCQSQRWPRLPGLVQASVFGYLYHEFLPVFQSNPRRGDRLGMAYCLVTGQIPHWVPHWPVGPSPLVANGTFEEWTDSVPASWQHVKGWQGKDFAGRPYRDEAVRHTGTSSLRLENLKDSDVVQVSQNVSIGPGALEPGRRYRATAWLKVESLAQPNGIGMAALTPRLRAKASWRIMLPEPSDWTRVRVEFTVPGAADFLRIMIHVNGPCRLWVDDMVIEEHVAGAWRPARRSGRPVEHDLAVQWVRLFHGEGRPYLLLGRMLRPPTLLAPTKGDDSHAPFPPILLNAFRAPDGSEAAVAVNVTDGAHDVRFQWRGNAWQLTMAPWTVQLVRAKQ